MNTVVIHPAASDPAAAIEVLDQLREQILSGQVIAFAAVAIEPDDTTTAWSSCTRPVTRLRMMGAITSLLHGYVDGA